MKKQISIFLILIFITGFIPFNCSKAITQNQIDAEVQIVCTDGTNWFSGSGTIIDPKGIILTNRHVVEGAYKDTCFIGFIEEINQEPNFGTAGNYNLAEVKYKTTTDDMDAAILYLGNPSNKIYPYVNIWDSNSDSLQFGDKVEVIGFPSIGGSTITYTSGDFSGFGSSSDGTQNYIKANVSINHGNSGGAAYDSQMSFIGMPTSAVIDINPIAYILSVESIKTWLSKIFGNNYKNQIIQQMPIIESNNNISVGDDITPPNINNLSLYLYQYFPDAFPCYEGIYHNYEVDNYQEIRTNKISFRWGLWTFGDRDVDGFYYYFGRNMFADPIKNGTYLQKGNEEYIGEEEILVGKGDYFVILKAKDKNNNLSESFIFTLNYIPSKDYIWETHEGTQYKVEQFDYNLAKRLKGYILLQVEFKGEAYYIYPDDSKKYYLGRPADAFNAMRKLGLGATHEFITSHTIYPDHVLGKILLDVEDQGKAYYIYPKDKKAYYLGKPADAFKVMRDLGLGITNNDLFKIPNGDL